MKHVSFLVVLGVVFAAGATASEPEPSTSQPCAIAPAADFGAEAAMAAAFAAQTESPGVESWTPPPCTGLFPDVPCSDPFAPWIEQLYRDQITAGCGDGLYCPDSAVSRAQMAVFLEKVARGTDRWPPNIVNVSVVLKQSGAPDPIASGQALLDAIAAIPGTAPQAPSGENPTVVRIGPGDYLLGGARLELPGYVHLHGEGRFITRIYSMADAPEAVHLKGFTEIKDLSIVIQASVGPAIGIVVEPGTGLRLIDAELFVSAAATVGTGIATQDSEVSVERSTIAGSLAGGSGWAVYVSGGGSFGLNVTDSLLWGSTHAVYNNSSANVNLNNTMLSGALYKGASASYRCRLNYNNTYGTVSCP